MSTNFSTRLDKLEVTRHKLDGEVKKIKLRFEKGESEKRREQFSFNPADKFELESKMVD